MKLYYAQGACSLAPMIVASWTGIDLELEKVDFANRGPSFYKVNPMGAVPTLVLNNGRAFSQAGAIMNYLSDLNPKAGLGGSNDEETIELNQWSSFLSSDFHPAFNGIFAPGSLITDPSESEIERITAAARINVGKVAKILDEKIADSGHVVLGRRTTADAHAFAMVRWIEGFPDGLKPYANLVKFIDRMKKDAGVQAAMAQEAQ